MHKTAGEGNGNSKLTAKEVVEIRRRRESGELLKQIAPDYDISMSTISLIMKGILWTHVR